MERTESRQDLGRKHPGEAAATARQEELAADCSSSRGWAGGDRFCQSLGDRIIRTWQESAAISRFLARPAGWRCYHALRETHE